MPANAVEPVATANPEAIAWPIALAVGIAISLLLFLRRSRQSRRRGESTWRSPWPKPVPQRVDPPLGDCHTPDYLDALDAIGTKLVELNADAASPDAAPLPEPPSKETDVGDFASATNVTKGANPVFRRQKTVNPGDVLITKSEALALVNKEGDRLSARLQDLLREAEILHNETFDQQQANFRELLGQFQELQDKREHDLALMLESKNELANELASAILKFRQAEAKATEGILQLKDQLEGVPRKLESQINDSQLAQERLSTALEVLRADLHYQETGQNDLRKELSLACEQLPEGIRKQEANMLRESAERRAAIAQLAFDIKTNQLTAENDSSLLVRQLNETKSLLATFGQRLERAEEKQAQALDTIYGQIAANEALDILKQRVLCDLNELKVRLDRGEANFTVLRQQLEKLQASAPEERNMLIKQLYQEVDRALAAAAQGSLTYREEIVALKEENTRLAQRQHQIVQLVAGLHSAVGKTDAHAAGELERIKAQNHELQQMVVSMLKGAKSPGGPTSATARPENSAPSALRKPVNPETPRPIDFWGRFLGREKASDRQDTSAPRKRRPHQGN
ncbi:MAG: hypothetical protein HY692_06625 [Cyanobacteria bacterium NC_groundwater_1444_Ag_S-0.65um_54_12]|nr:hypothetical protein [Cyanobacteria bacterium NC_groundwater_1444_Ag_S-0.65um_54_12]